MALSPLCTTLIFDFRCSLLIGSPSTTTPISPEQVRAIFRSPSWYAYEKGHLEEDERNASIGQELSVPPEAIRQAILDARYSLKPNDQLLAFLRELKERSKGRLSICALSSSSAPDYDSLRSSAADSNLFDKIYRSGHVGRRRPNNRMFLKHALGESGIDPSTAVFLDDKAENVAAARSLGFNGIVFNDIAEVWRTLRNYADEPIARARAFLAQNASKLESTSADGVTISENFSQLLILEATGDRSLVHFTQPPAKWNFFRDEYLLPRLPHLPVFTTDVYPCDLDTTSVGLMVSPPEPDVLHRVLDEILEYRDEEDLVMTYFDRSRARVDPIVCVNALSLFYSQGRGGELGATLDFVHDVLLHRAYIGGTRYYESSEAFLFFASRLLQSTADSELHARLRPLLIERLKERVGVQGDALVLAMRVLACASIGVRDTRDAYALRMMQEEDGGWPFAPFYKFPKLGVRAGNRGLTTALAINALLSVEGESPHPSAKMLGASSSTAGSASGAALPPPTSKPATTSLSESPSLIPGPPSTSPVLEPRNSRTGSRFLSSIRGIVKRSIGSVFA